MTAKPASKNNIIATIPSGMPLPKFFAAVFSRFCRLNLCRKQPIIWVLSSRPSVIVIGITKPSLCRIRPALTSWSASWKLTASLRDVRFYPETRHVRCGLGCPLWANSGHLTFSLRQASFVKTVLYLEISSGRRNGANFVTPDNRDVGSCRQICATAFSASVHFSSKCVARRRNAQQRQIIRMSGEQYVRTMKTVHSGQQGNAPLQHPSAFFGRADRAG